MEGQVKIFHVGSHQFRESLRKWLRELWFSYCTSRETPFREWSFAFRESVSEFREMLREYPGTLQELREWPFRSESVFPEIGVVRRLLNYSAIGDTISCDAPYNAIGFKGKQAFLAIPPLQGLSLDRDRKKSGVRVRFRVRFQAGKVPNFDGFPVENPTKKATGLKGLLTTISLSEYGSEVFRVRLRRLSEYGLVGACLATGDRIFATGSDSVSKTVLRSCGCLALISGHTIMV